MKLFRAQRIRLWQDAASRWRHERFDDFAFIHINKTAGRSIESALKIPFEHATAREKIARIGLRRWRRKYTFAVVRNPFDRVVSHYHYRLGKDATLLKTRPVPFNRWVELAYGRRDSRYYDNPKMFLPCMDWISDEDGKVLVTFVARFENLNDDFATICGHIFNRRMTAPVLPHVNASQRGHYRDYYDDAGIDVVRRHFARDIEAFSYDY